MVLVEEWIHRRPAEGDVLGSELPPQPDLEKDLAEDVRAASNFLNYRPLKASEHGSRFVINGHVLSFTGGNKVI